MGRGEAAGATVCLVASPNSPLLQWEKKVLRSSRQDEAPFGERGQSSKEDLRASQLSACPVGIAHAYPRAASAPSACMSELGAARFDNQTLPS